MVHMVEEEKGEELVLVWARLAYNPETSGQFLSVFRIRVDSYSNRRPSGSGSVFDIPTDPDLASEIKLEEIHC